VKHFKNTAELMRFLKHFVFLMTLLNNKGQVYSFHCSTESNHYV